MKTRLLDVEVKPPRIEGLYLDDMRKPLGTHTREVVIKKGSEGRVTPLSASTKRSGGVGGVSRCR